MISQKETDRLLQEIEQMLLAVLDAEEAIIGDPQMASAAATLLDFSLHDIHRRVVNLRAAIR
jgi:hypothetical protein